MERQQAVKPSKTNSTSRNHLQAQAAPQKPTPFHPVLQLQRKIGNQAVTRLLSSGGIQAKLKISQPGDKYEQEADRVADQVMRMPNPADKVIRPSSAPLLVQRVCTKCEEKLQRKAEPGVKPVGEAFEHPSSGGRPLPDSERRFFEPRLGRDLSSVRIHTGPQAGAAARSVDALAYTMRNDIVFTEGQYQPGSDKGRTLLAHELAHVIQQGAASSPSLQRLGNRTQAPAALACPIATTSSADPVATNVLFSISASSLSPTAIAEIAAFVSRWHSAGTNPVVRVDGFASTDGPDPLNWTLSCDRASTVARELESPSSGARGIPDNFIDVFAQGETSEFGSALDLNRRATISANLAAPAPPACANPGEARILELQPVFLRTDPTDTVPTGVSWTRRFNEANAIWGKIGVTFVGLSPIILDTPLKTTGSTIPEIVAIRALRSGPGIEVFLADNDLAVVGGGFTLRGCGGSGKVVMTDHGTSDTLLAHELVHTLFDSHDHPPTVGELGTIAEPSGSPSTDNPRRNTMVNFAAVQCPAPTGSTCLNPDV